MSADDKPCQATPPVDLRQQIMDSRVPKNEREWWASRLIEKLERELAAERARLDWLMAGGVCMVQHSGGFYVSRLHAQVSRAAIDAAMKEETK